MKSNYIFWKNIWDKKGQSDSKDLLFLDGYDHLSNKFNSFEISKNIVETLGIKDYNTVLEVGCGCGFLSRELCNMAKYVGVDYSQNIISKHKKMFDHDVFVCEADDLSFKDNEFDFVFCFGLFQYLPSLEYANNVLLEMDRVSKYGFFLGDLKNEKTRDTHFVYPKNILIDKNYKFTNCIYDPSNPSRYNAYFLKDKEEKNDLE